MSDALEKTSEVVCDNNNVSDDQTIQLNPGNGACTYHVGSGTDEVSHLLSTPQVTENNGEQHIVDVVDVSNGSSTETSKWRRELRSLKTELNEVVVWKLRLWVVILLIFLVIALVIGISVIVCAVIDDDGDENYDKSSFVVERFFRGKFTLDNSSTSYSLEKETLLEQLEQKLTGVYSSSPALERYFSNATINHLQDTTAQFKIKFMMPSEHEELVRYTLSLKMVKNVLVQHLYDQDTGDPLYIIPTSVSMELG
ncbi:TPA-induced transmembrane protein [Megalobrama amblycephala]|uniref:TPA-induced transmembrane protein n=1 Tax=Megalobrama amblycephala TaxID=75352 RepID=UPI002013C912|nr:TPA-induced transmembrane protein [Megalobrama amblycephala]XP_048016407.1 TPA-induced transmembrane protein [Megalobrama amblycephala]